MVTGTVKGVKVVLKLTEGSQTIPDCSKDATNDQLYALGSAVAELEKDQVEAISKIEETTLISE